MNPFRRKKKQTEEIAEMRARLKRAEQEKCAVAEQGKARQKLLRRLEQHLAENGFAERLMDSMEQSRRRRLT